MFLNGVDTTNVKVTLPTKKDGANVLTYNTNLGLNRNYINIIK